MTFVGLDLHKRYITACALSDAGDVLAEDGHFRMLASLANCFIRPQLAKR
jgi:hypothetical protein